MRRTKYIITETSFSNPIVFPEWLNHNDVARALGGEVVGAGFCYIDQSGRYVCYGESISLKIPSRGLVDSEVLNNVLNSQE